MSGPPVALPGSYEISVEYDGKVLDPRRVRLRRVEAEPAAGSAGELSPEQLGKLRRQFEGEVEPPTILPDGPALTRLEPGSVYALRAPKLDPGAVDGIRRVWREAWPESEPHPTLLLLAGIELEELDDAALAAAGLARIEEKAV